MPQACVEFPANDVTSMTEVYSLAGQTLTREGLARETTKYYCFMSIHQINVS